MVNHFNIMAKEWDTAETIERNQQFAQGLKKHLAEKQFEVLLDLGCGTGLLTQHFIQNAKKIIGIDTSEGMLQVFNQRFKHLHKVQSFKLDLLNDDWPLKNNHVDLVISAMAFHHLEHPERMLQKLKSLLGPNGMICIIDLDQEDGSFHPDNAKMGVKHFGFSEQDMARYAELSDLKIHRRFNIFNFHKNGKQYPVTCTLITQN